MNKEFEKCRYTWSINDIPDEVLSEWADEMFEEESYYGEYMDLELENEYYAQLENDFFYEM